MLPEFLNQQPVTAESAKTARRPSQEPATPTTGESSSFQQALRDRTPGPTQASSATSRPGADEAKSPADLRNTRESDNERRPAVPTESAADRRGTETARTPVPGAEDRAASSESQPAREGGRILRLDQSHQPSNETESTESVAEVAPIQEPGSAGTGEPDTSIDVDAVPESLPSLLILESEAADALAILDSVPVSVDAISTTDELPPELLVEAAADAGVTAGEEDRPFLDDALIPDEDQQTTPSTVRQVESADSQDAAESSVLPPVDDLVVPGEEFSLATLPSLQAIDRLFPVEGESEALIIDTPDAPAADTPLIVEDGSLTAVPVSTDDASVGLSSPSQVVSDRTRSETLPTEIAPLPSLQPVENQSETPANSGIPSIPGTSLGTGVFEVEHTTISAGQAPEDSNRTSDQIEVVVESGNNHRDSSAAELHVADSKGTIQLNEFVPTSDDGGRAESNESAQPTRLVAEVSSEIQETQPKSDDRQETLPDDIGVEIPEVEGRQEPRSGDSDSGTTEAAETRNRYDSETSRVESARPEDSAGTEASAARFVNQPEVAAPVVTASEGARSDSEGRSGESQRLPEESNRQEASTVDSSQRAQPVYEAGSQQPGQVNRPVAGDASTGGSDSNPQTPVGQPVRNPDSSRRSRESRPEAAQRSNQVAAPDVRVQVPTESTTTGASDADPETATSNVSDQSRSNSLGRQVTAAPIVSSGSGLVGASPIDPVAASIEPSETQALASSTDVAEGPAATASSVTVESASTGSTKTFDLGTGPLAEPSREAAVPVEIRDAVSAIQQASSGDGHIRVRLNPPELGTMQVEVVRTDNGVVARLEVESTAAHSVVLETLVDLQQSLSRSGSAVERVEVILNEARAEAGRQDGDQTQNREQQGRQERQSSDQQRQNGDRQHRQREEQRGQNSDAESATATVEDQSQSESREEFDVKL